MLTTTEIPLVSSQPSIHWRRRFFTIWSGQALSLLGSSLGGFALVWWLTASTGSATVLAVSTLMMLLPQFALSPLAGALVDRWSRRAVMLAADGLIALASLGLALLFIFGAARIWHVFVVIFIRAAGSAFHTPAMQASTPLMVPEKHLTRVAGINQTLQGVMNMASPPLAALLLGVLPVQGVLLIDVSTALLAVLPLFFTAIPNPPRTAAAAPTTIGQDMRDGLRFVWGWPGLFIIMVTACLLNMLNIPAMSFIPLLVTEHFGLGVLELGWMETAFGVGILCGGLLLGILNLKRRILPTLAGVVLMGVGLLVCGLAPANAFPLALAGNLLGTLASTAVSGLIFAMVQSIVPPEMLGRVFSLMLSAAAGMAPLGLLVAGPLADRLGVQFWFILAGGVTVLVGLGLFFFPALACIEDGRKRNCDGS